MKNRHALIDAETGIVTNVVIWDGDTWRPPHGHYVVHNSEGEIGDYWHQDKNCFYTAKGKHRFRNEEGKIGEKEMNEEEKKFLHPWLKEKYRTAQKKYSWSSGPDLSKWNSPKLEKPETTKPSKGA